MIIGKKVKKPTLVSEELQVEYRIEDGEAEFVKYMGTKDEYEVPETIDGCLVTRIGSYAFAEMRNMISIKLPKEIRTIGAHAFYNCRAMEELEFGDQLIEIEDGAFKNCTSFSHMILRTDSDKPLTIKNILMDTIEGIRVTIRYEDLEKKHSMEEKREEGDAKADMFSLTPEMKSEPIVTQAELMFPPYLVEYEENTPGRTFDKQAYGSGERYRHCLYDGKLNFEQYDKLLDFSIAMDDIAYPIQCAIGRLRYPYALKEEARVHYEAFMEEYKEKVLEYLIRKEDQNGMEWMLLEKRLSREDLDYAMSCCRKTGKNGLLPMLMEYQNQQFKPKKKDFNF